MRKKLFFHIGQTKTGSTSLQRFLHVNRAALAVRGVFYPPRSGAPGEEPGAQHHHRDLFTALQQAGPAPADTTGAWASLVQAIQAHLAPVAVVSCELFWHLFVGRGALRLQALQWMARQLSAFDVRIVCYLRPQDEWVEAMYNQLVKSGQTPVATQPFEHFLQRPQTNTLMDYARVLAPWAQVFGPQALTVRAFERANLVAGDVVDDFLALLGQDDLQGLARQPDAQQRISWPVCELLTAFNRVPDLNPLREAFVRFASDSIEAGPRARLLDAAAVQAMRARHEPGNAQVAQAYCARATLFEPPAGEGDHPVYGGLSPHALADVLVKLFAAQHAPGGMVGRPALPPARGVGPRRRRTEAQAR